jgi:hypothetical protein
MRSGTCRHVKINDTHGICIYITRKESLNTDGHQFHQYQQNKQSPLILTELTEHKKDHDI